jgi:hypothetical protein
MYLVKVTAPEKVKSILDELPWNKPDNQEWKFLWELVDYERYGVLSWSVSTALDITECVGGPEDLAELRQLLNATPEFLDSPERQFQIATQYTMHKYDVVFWVFKSDNEFAEASESPV